MNKIDIEKLKTIGDLKSSNYTSRSIKEELRQNLSHALKNKTSLFDGIHGYEDSVLPDIERAILSKHNILLLGLRGQAKTKIARQLPLLLDEYMPVVQGSEINDDPLNPISDYAIQLIKENGDDTKIDWMHRSHRYVEKLATPDVNIADLIGDIDPIKAATLKLPYSDPRVIHYGLIPRANRCIFTLNELPDLQARIQVSLFNILEEGDIQIRGFKLRLPLEIQFVFTANPEDYTNRGSIITPLKDRIESQILTHYPDEIEHSIQITRQEAKIEQRKLEAVTFPDVLAHIIEYTVNAARESELVDAKSGVSARLAISALENLYSTAERRMLLKDEGNTVARISDLLGIVPSMVGKLELLYEGEQEGAYNVAMELMNQGMQTVIEKTLSTIDQEQFHRALFEIKAWFGDNNQLILAVDASHGEYFKKILEIPGMEKILALFNDEEYPEVYAEMILHHLGISDELSRELFRGEIKFMDQLSDLLSDMDDI